MGQLYQTLSTYLDPDEVETARRAYDFAADAHAGQKRDSGEDYVTHPLAVAQILADMRLDISCIVAALLHDVLEDTTIDKETMSQTFTPEVTYLVDGVSKLTQMKFSSYAQEQAENFRKMMLATAQDVRVILIKLADRLHNMRTIGACSPERRRRKARETLEIYAPIAHRLGMYNFHVEFTDLAFSAMYPLRYRVIQNAVKQISGNRKAIITDIESRLKEELSKFDLPADAVHGREKRPSSIYRKMREKKLPFSALMDVYSFRITVNSLDACYRVIGIVHNLYKPVPERFRDYIAIPKANGYRSLHTTLFGPFGIPIEIQVRSRDMEQTANNGVLVHWLNPNEQGAAKDMQSRTQYWLQTLAETQKRMGNSVEFVETLKTELFPEEVYVFTPKGEIIELPVGATPIDFAYAIHSDIGNSCVAAKIDRRLAPLSTALSNGQRIEIITAASGRPNPAWINFSVTGKARSSIRHFLKHQQETEAIALGKRLLNQSLKTRGLDWENLAEEAIKKALDINQFSDENELFLAIGLGNKLTQIITEQLLRPESSEAEKIEAHQADPILIKGTEGVVLRFSECCYPIPGDPIVGVLETGRGISVHHEQCKLIRKSTQLERRLIDLQWENTVDGNFRTEIILIALNQTGILAKITTTIATTQVNINRLHIDEYDGQYNMVTLLLSVNDRTHLAQVMRRLRSLKEISRLARSKDSL